MGERGPAFLLHSSVTFACVALAGCGSNSEMASTRESQTLDRLCEGASQCELEGEARLTTGVTADGVGIELGPGSGSVTFLFPETAGFWMISVLMGFEHEAGEAMYPRRVGLTAIPDDVCPVVTADVSVSGEHAWQAFPFVSCPDQQGTPSREGWTYRVDSDANAVLEIVAVQTIAF